MYEARRSAFMSKMQPKSVAIFRSAPEFALNREHELPYRQDSDFYYLTGFPEPEAICVLAPDHKEHHYILFVRKRDPLMETWNGRRAGTEGAVEHYGADIAYTLDQLDEQLPHYLENVSTLYYYNGVSQFVDVQLIEQLKRYQGRIGPIRALLDPNDILDQLRLVKQPDEIELLRKATAISAEGHVAAMKATRSGMYEYQIQAALEYVFRDLGALRVGYESIVGSGPNTTILHYAKNTRRVEDGDLVLIDAGAEYDYYSGDITRTFPANGHFTAEQHAIYEIVLRANKAAIESVQPGKTLEDVHNITVEIITRGLLELGILQGEHEKIIEEKAYQTFYMHGASHWLGLDVHDRGPYKVEEKWLPFVPGMVITVEPGIYIAEGTEGVDAKYWNIGVRVEDNVLITEDGCENLTTGVPKEPEQIEALMARS